ncbi:transmembrane protein 53-like isoform X2 [Ambystoma mexicanum]
MKCTTSASLPLVSDIVVKKVTGTINLYSRSSTPTGDSGEGDDPRPLVLMLPWLGSKQSSITRYCQLYLEHGFDVLAVESSVLHFLWPRHGLTYAAEVLDLLQNEKVFSSRPLYVHAFSIGAYTFTQMLLHMGRDSRRYSGTRQQIKAQVYDSLVLGSMERMAIGVAKMISSSLLVSLIKRAIMLYFLLLKRYTVDYYNAAIDVFRLGPLDCPALFFYCEDDPLSDHIVMAQIIEEWREKGIDVVGKGWVNSKHAGHLRRHPQEYQDILNNFLQQQHPVGYLKSKL